MTIVNQPEERDLFSIRTIKKNFNSRKISKKSSSSKKKKKPNVEEEEVVVPRITHVPLTYENLAEGQIILGCISEIRKYEMVISLPYRMQGYLPITHISSAYKNLIARASYGEEVSEEIYSLDEMYSVGQLLITKVKTVKALETGHSRVLLSILPEDVNSDLRPSALRKGNLVQSAVVSTEENGFIVDTGMKNLRAAFLNKRQAPDGKVGIGSVFMCAVKKVIKDDDEFSDITFKLSSKPERVMKGSMFTENFDLSTIVPGTLIDAVVDYVSNDGLEISSSFCKGFVRKEKLTSPFDTLRNYEIGKRVLARVLYIEGLTNHLICTLNTAMCQENVLKEPLQGLTGLSVDDVLKNCKVCKSSKEGLYLTLKDDCYGFCSGNKLGLKKPSKEQIASKYPVGSSHTCKIVSVNLIDQLFIVNIKGFNIHDQNSSLDQKVGERLTVKILEFNNHGAVVSIKDDAKGFVPNIHLTDSNMKNPELKHPAGKLLKARILKFYPLSKINLTFKSELINTKLPIVSNYENSNVGVSTLGCVVKVYPNGLLLEFFGNTHAFVHKNEIHASMRNNLDSYFSLGMIVNCKITKVDEGKREMKASLIKNSVNENLRLKSFVNGEVVSIENDTVQIQIENKNIRAYIPFYHLSDDNEMSNALLQQLKKGDVVRNAVVYRKESETYTLSLKPLVYQYLQLRKGETVVNKGDIFPCIITNVLDDKIYVSCLKGDLGTNFSIPRKNVYDIPLTMFKSHLEESEINLLSLKCVEVGQTVFVKCLSREKNSVELAANLNLVKRKEDHSLQVLLNTLLSEGLVRNWYENKFRDIEVGSHITGKVLIVLKVGALVKIDNYELYGVVLSSHYNSGEPPQKNNSLQFLVIHKNYRHGSLELSLKSNLKVSCQENHGVEVGQKVLCEILLAKREYIIGRMVNHCIGQIIYLPAKRHINDFKGRQSFYEIGKTYMSKVMFIQDSLILGNLEEHCTLHEINILNEIPVIDIKEGDPLLPAKSLNLDKEKCTKFLFKKRGQELIYQIAQFRERKRKNVNIFVKDKFSVLMEDNFHQFDDDRLWDYIVAKRKERRKLKEVGSKEKKRKQSVSKEPNKRLRRDETDNNEDHSEASGGSENQGKRRKKSGEEPNKCLKTEERKIIKSCETANKKTENKEDKACKNMEGVSRKQKSNKSEDLTGYKNERKKEDKEEDGGGNKSKHHSLQVSSCGFDWSGKLYNAIDANTNNSSSDEDEDTDKSKEQKSVKRLGKFEKAVKAKLEEKKTRKLELERLDPDRKPETALDYEEMVEKMPHSSAVWTEYISFHLENAETEKAKGVAARALKVIPATLEEERLAIWNVSLRLEVMYGTPESIQNAFKEAVITNDELKVFYIMMDIYANANKLDEAKDIIRIMTKKYSRDREVWIKAGLFYFKTDQTEEARTLLEKSLLSLAKHDQIDVINRFAQLEMKYGDPERGKTIFEKVLTNFPKRLDIWYVYADLLLKNKDIQGTRLVLERITGLKLKMSAIRTAFKKLLEFEKQYGTPKQIEAVKARVEEYVASALKEDGV